WTLSLEEEDGRIRGSLEYATELFDAATIERVLRHLRTLLAGAVALPETLLSALPLLDLAERRQLLEEWNATRVVFPRGVLIHELFEAQAATAPKRPAITFDGETLTYRELDERANRLAHHLRRLGVGPEVLVGLCVERSANMIVGLLGILKAGGAYVPLDPTHPAERLARVLEDADVAVLVTEDRFALATPTRIVSLDRHRDEIVAERPTAPERWTDEEGLAYVIYTSGSTGRPKGVQLPHRPVVNFLRAMAVRPGFGPEDAVPALTTLSFDIAGLEIYLPLMMGGRIEMISREEASDGRRLAERIASSRVTVMQGTPATWRLLVDSGWNGLAGLKGLCGGEALPRGLADALLVRGVELWNVYGPTETAIWSAAGKVVLGEEGPVSLGQPIDNTRLYIVDQGFRPVPVGVPGELWIAGDGVARGYLRRADLTADRFIADPFSDEPGARLYRTGDLVRYRGPGEIEFLGRIDYQVKIRGFRIEPGEIEAVLEQHPKVREAVVRAVGEPHVWQRLVAYVLPEEDRQVTAEVLQSFLSRVLPAYMMPSAFMLMDALPRTTSGKVDRKALPAPEELRGYGARERAAPRTPMEELLATFWSEVIGRDEIGVDEDFFALGGDSLLAMRVVTRVRERLGAELPVRDIFESRTVAKLAAEVEGKLRAGLSVGAPPLKRASRVGWIPMSFAQQRLWFLDRLEPGSTTYNLFSTVQVSGRLDLEVLQRCLCEIVRRHETLRTTFDEVDGEPVQIVSEELPPEFRIVDLGSLDARERVAAELQLASEEARRPFELTRGPLLRVAVLRSSPDDHLILFNMHHGITDGWSFGVMVREIVALYEAFVVGMPSPLAELPYQYADFALWQRERLGHEALASLVSYWRDRLAGAPAVLDLPSDRPRAPQRSRVAGREPVALPPRVVEALRATCRCEGVTPFMALLAAFEALLFRHTEQTDFCVGSPVASRFPIETEPMIGLFVNTLVLRASLNGNLDYRGLLGLVRETVLEAHANKELPFEKLVDELRPERSLAHTPFFQVFFALHADLERAFDIPGLELRIVDPGSGMAMLEVTLLLVVSDSGIAGVLEYERDLFDASTMQRMAGHLLRLLEAMLAAPSGPVGELPLLSEAERHVLHLGWNDTAVQVPSCRLAHELFEAQVERAPEVPAVIGKFGVMSYRELNARANGLAHELRRLGIGAEALVGICCGRSPDLAIARLAVLKAGGAYVPLDPTYPAERLAWLLEDARVRLLLTQSKWLGSLPGGIPALCLDCDGEWLGVPGALTNPRRSSAPESLAYVIYTSGSTGRPKGAMVDHRALVNYTLELARHFELGPGDRMFQFASVGFDVVEEELFPILSRGGAVVFEEDQERLLSCAELSQILEARGVTTIELPAAYWHEWAAEIAAGRVALPSSLRLLIVGSEKPLPERVRDWLSTGVPLIYIFGLTETTITSTLHGVAAEDQLDLPIGRPIANTRVHLLDLRGELVPSGVRGELFIGGTGVGRGYLDRPELTAERFVPDPFSLEPGQRLYRTGDLARLRPNGELDFLGRIDGQIKIRGFRVELGEIEATLARHPAVREAVVVARGEAGPGRRLVAYVIPRKPLDRKRNRAHPTPVLWPSHGEYPIYDDLLYGAMAEDEERNRRYREAIAEAVRDKVVLDIGTGAELVLSRLCVEAGARKVYAIEAMEESYRHARERVEALGLADRISLIHGWSTEVELPERVDVCVSELIGCIGGSEGAAAILNDAKRFLKPDGRMIPSRCITRIAAVRAPDSLVAEPRLTPLGARYARQIFDLVGCRFDLRLCVKDFPLSHFISDAGIFETLDFRDFALVNDANEIRLEIRESSRLDGFLLWIELFPGDSEKVDSLHHDCAWLPMYLPAFEGVEVAAGDVVTAVCRTILSDDGIHPDYEIAGTVSRRDGLAVRFSHWSLHHQPSKRSSKLHQALFGGASIPVQDPAAHELSGERLLAFLAGQLPEPMLPSAFVLLDALPQTPHGKIDLRALPDPDDPVLQSPRADQAPRNQTEEVLAGVWAEVLGRQGVSIHANFFELGGDSILCLQVVSRAHRHGLDIRPRQIFEHQTIARLAAVAVAASNRDTGPVLGEVPLTPVQRWFFERGLEEPWHWNMSAALEAKRPLDASLLRKAIAVLQAHHDALRFRYERRGSDWVQRSIPPDGEVPFWQVDLSGIPAEGRPSAIDTLVRQLQPSLDLARGPLLRAVLVECGEEPAQLVAIVHHLIVDGVSWRILLEDLQTIYSCLEEGGDGYLALPARTTSFRRWAECLAEYAASEELAAQANLWLGDVGKQGGPLPVDGLGDNTEASARTVSVALAADDTRRLLQEVPRAYRVQTSDLLLTALAKTLARWSGTGLVAVDLEGHGREEIAAGLDLSRTVGWFTSVYPVVVDLRDAPGPKQTLQVIKEETRRASARGLSHGVLRYLGRDQGLADRLRDLPGPQVIFNYLGQFDQAFGTSPLFSPVREPMADMVSPRGLRRHELEVNCAVSGGRLEVSWTYSENLHSRGTVEGLALQLLEELRSLIDHCLTSGERGLTPSDFPLTRLESSDLERILESYPELEDLYPLSPMQEGMLFHVLSEPDAGVYFAQLHAELRGDVDAAALEQAWQQVLGRHGVLRTAFVWQGLDRPLQAVLDRSAFTIDQRDWRGFSPVEQEELLERLLEEDRGRVLDFAQSPLMRFFLLRLGDHLDRFVWSHHQMVLDGWSLPVVFGEVLALHDAFIHGKRLVLEEPRPYRSYIEWLDRQDLTHAEAFWRRTLALPVAATRLDLEHPSRTAVVSTSHARHRIRLAVRTTAALRDFALRHLLTLNTLVQGAWALLLSRYGTADQVMFGVTVSGRPADLEGVETLVGLFINTLPVRMETPPGEPLVSWLQGLQAGQAEMRQYEHTPLARIQSWLDWPAGTPLFESFLVFQNYPMDELPQAQDAGLEIGGLEIVERAHYPAAVMVSPADELLIEIEYDAARYAASAIDRLLAHLKAILEGFAAAPRQLLGDVPLFSKEERATLLVEWNDTGRSFPGDCTAHELFAAQAQRTPAAAAVVYAQEHLSYSELDSRANRLARRLKALGIGPESRVGICTRRSPSLAVAILGVLKAGSAFIPLDPDYPKERLHFLAADAGIKVAVVEDGCKDVLSSLPVRMVLVDGDAPAQVAGDLTPFVSAKSLAFVIYTSGSTGRPKGVMVEHRSLVNYALEAARCFGLGGDDRVLQFAPMGFDVIVEELFPVWLSGGTVVFESPDLLASIQGFTEALERNRVTTVELPAPFWHEWVNDLMAEGGTPPASLRRVLVGCEKPSGEWLAAWAGTGIPLLIVFGLTETTITSTVHAAVVPGEEIEPEPPIGRPVANTRLYLLDRRIEPVPIGVPGELFIGGEGVARGYLNRPDLTAVRFIPDLFGAVPGSRLYRTGDLARYRGDGCLEFLGRMDDQLKIRGFRVEPGEIESALSAHPAVKDCIVIARRSARGSSLAAYLVWAKPENSPSLEVIRKHLEVQLPAHMIPAVFVPLEAIPVTASGKIDRNALPEPDLATGATTTDHVEPRNPTEKALAEIWAQVLGLQRVGVRDDFFHLGGDSILSIQIVSRAHRAGLRLSPRQIFEHPTIAELAGIATGTQIFEQEQGPVAGHAPLTAIQRWFLEQDLPNRSHWNMSVLLELQRPLNPVLLGRAMEHVIEHHDALRLRLVSETGGWRQVHAEPSDPVPVLRIDFRSLPENLHAVAFAAAADRLQASLDLERGPVLRLALFDFGDGTLSRLLVVLHHYHVDNVSLRILLEDLEAGYEMLGRGFSAQLPPKTTSFQRWGELLIQHVQSGVLDGEIGYWLAQASPRPLSLPIDFADGANRESSSEMLEVDLDPEVTSALLRELPKAFNARVDEILLAALARALQHWTADDLVLLEMEGHGREQLPEGVDLTRTVGWFTSQFPVLLDLQDADTPVRALARIKECLRAIPNRGVGYGLLRYLRAEDAAYPLSLVPRPQVIFEYMGQLDRALSYMSPFRLLPDSAGNANDPEGLRPHLLSVGAGVLEGSLRTFWNYSSNLHRRHTIEQVAQSFRNELESLVAACRRGEGAYAPCDFPLVKLDQGTVERLAGIYGGIQDVMPLSPLQQGMLFHSIYEPDAGMYVAQFGFELQGNLDVDAFDRAWQKVIERHAALRTAFVWQGLDEPLQVVCTGWTLPLE
ncbi:MAG TPA: amino acid adenylation domain-containing protein, partial [Thermoanaerobaculia bacterium]|nr:amino acid adenylation domain-containing protein [Thermoanaerobaculia bacterium]